MTWASGWLNGKWVSGWQGKELYCTFHSFASLFGTFSCSTQLQNVLERKKINAFFSRPLFYVCSKPSIVACGWRLYCVDCRQWKNVHHCLPIRWRTWRFQSKPRRKHEEEKFNFHFRSTTVWVGLSWRRGGGGYHVKHASLYVINCQPSLCACGVTRPPNRFYVRRPAQRWAMNWNFKSPTCYFVLNVN